LRRPSTLRLLFVAIWLNPMFRARGLTYPSGYRLIQQFPGGWSANRFERIYRKRHSTERAGAFRPL
jgi:hypothetical protein